MARDRERASLVYQVEQNLKSKLAIGESKHQGKIDGTYKENIYSWTTFRNYMKQVNYFTRWAKETYGCKTLVECRPYVNEWLQKRSIDGISAATQKLDASALAKLYDCSTRDFIKTDIRHRSGITRSRGPKERDKHFSEKNNKDLIGFCKSTGLRRQELQNLRGDKLIYKNGSPYVVVDKGAKTGRYREVPVILDKDLVIRKMKEAGSGKVFEKLHNAADIHGYRSEYATSYYKSLARPIESIPYDKINKGSGKAYQSEVYSCRGDLRGFKYDKKAMKEVSEALGHNRISVIAGHYLRD